MKWNFFLSCCKYWSARGFEYFYWFFREIKFKSIKFLKRFTRKILCFKCKIIYSDQKSILMYKSNIFNSLNFMLVTNINLSKLAHFDIVINVLSKTLPLSGPMFAGITQHRGRSIQIHVYFMFTIVTCTIELTLCRSDLLDLILSSLSLSTLMPLGILKPLLIVLWLSVALNCSSLCQIFGTSNRFGVISHYSQVSLSVFVVLCHSCLFCRWLLTNHYKSWEHFVLCTKC